MKTAIYIEDGRTQFVLTPETIIDRKVLDEMESTDKLKTYRGTFYDCQGGWTRQEDGFGPQFDIMNMGRRTNDERSLIFVIDKDAPTPERMPTSWQLGSQA